MLRLFHAQDEPAMVILYRMKNEHGKAITLARAHRGDISASGGAGVRFSLHFTWKTRV
jgi:hypothetical protein